MQIKLKSMWVLLAAMLVIIMAIIFCCFYLFASYPYLADWYLRINNVFYRHQFWQRDFFTEEVKHQGNLFCYLGLLTAFYMAYIISKHLNGKTQTLNLFVSTKNLAPILVCLLIGSIAWVWGYQLVHEGFDEVFSAVNIAQLPSFQALSYYMLPNNHILYNFLNDFFSSCGNNPVITGKIISLFCYWGVIVMIFNWLSGLIKNITIVLLATILLSMQFPVWGFAFEARGYELYLLIQWICFYASIKYFNSKNSSWLYLCILTVTAGYFCIPTFLYFHLAIILTGVLWMLYQRKIDIAFFKCQFYALAFVYLLYLPAISFSGIKSLIANPYVSPKLTGLHQTLFSGIDKFQSYLGYYTSIFSKTYRIINWMLFLFPLVLFFFSKNKTTLLYAVFYISLWISCIALAFGMRNFPLERSINAHLSITLALTIYSFYLVFNKFCLRGIGKVEANIFCGMVLTGFILLVISNNKLNVNTKLYNNDINMKYIFLNKAIEIIPRGSTIAFSDECFYISYLCKTRGDKISKQYSGNEQYYIRLHTDEIPATCLKSYMLIKTVFKKDITSTAYEIYKRQSLAIEKCCF